MVAEINELTDANAPPERVREEATSMSSEPLALGISHKTAPVAVRERLALTTPEAQRSGQELVATDAIREAVAISTCNRTEITWSATPSAPRPSCSRGWPSARARARPS